MSKAANSANAALRVHVHCKLYLYMYAVELREWRRCLLRHMTVPSRQLQTSERLRATTCRSLLCLLLCLLLYLPSLPSPSSSLLVALNYSAKTSYDCARRGDSHLLSIGRGKACGSQFGNWVYMKIAAHVHAMADGRLQAPVRHSYSSTPSL